MNRTVIRSALVLLLVSGCRAKDPATPGFEISGRDNAHVTLGSEGSTVMAVWAATGSSGADIYLASSADSGRHFGEPVRVNDLEGEASASGEQPPRVVIHGSTVHVLWVAKPGGTPAIRTARSTDGGRTFAQARTVTPEGINGARGWESAAIGQDGAVHVAWLDGRASGVQPGHHHHAGGPAPRQDVFHAVLTDAPAAVETRVAANVCFCCKTAILSRGGDVYVAWRHLFDGGIRDIAIARSADSGRTFTPPARVSADNWKIDACPDDGPAMAFDGRGALHVVWPTLVREGGRDGMAIFHAMSANGELSFSSRERVDSGRNTSASHPRIAAGPDGSLVIVWDEMTDGGRQVAARRWTGQLGKVEILARSKASSYPAVAGTSDGYVAAWTEQQEESGSRIVMVRLPK